MCDHWTEAKLFKFLRLYKRHECLWNPYSSEYRNGDAKSQAFSKILYEMNIFGLTVIECLKQIKYVRQTYKDEQQRLESLATLGGRGFSKLLWYPMMNSMLSKVVRDEEKLSQATGTGLDLVVASNRPPHNSGDERNRRELHRTGYGRRSLPWAGSETTSIFSYLPNLSYGDYMNRYSDRMVPNNNCDGMCAENEHLCSCPTCGYSSGSSCDCFSMNDIPYNSEIIQQSYESNDQSQIDYRPRTSYNYRNGILEINSAVRIPVSQPSPNFGYSRLIESIEEPGYNVRDSTSDRQPDLQNIEEVQESSTECCAKSFNCNFDGDRLLSDEYTSLKIFDEAADRRSNALNSPIKKNVKIKSDNWRLTKPKRTMGINVDKILCAQKLMGPISAGANSICSRIEQEKKGAVDNKFFIIDPNNMNSDIQFPNISVIAEEELKVDVNTTFNEANVKLDPVLTRKENITIKISRAKLKCNEELFNTAKSSGSRISDARLESPGSGKTKTGGESDTEGLQESIDDCNKKQTDRKASEDLVQKSKDIVKRNLTKIVIDFIDETLSKPAERTTIDAGERLILKKVVKDLKLAPRDESNCVCNGKAMSTHHQQSQENRSTKSRNKTICWREPIEESFNIVPCRSTRSPANNGSGSPRLIGGADSYSHNDTAQPDPVGQKETLSQNKQSTSDTFIKNLGLSCTTNDGKSNEHLVRHNEFNQTKKSAASNLQNVEIYGQTIKTQSNLTVKNCEEDQGDSMKSSDSSSTMEELAVVENGVTIKISIETSGSTENEVVDKVVNKITEITRKTLDKSGYSIEKEEFCEKRNLITNDDGEISGKLIGNEAVWRTELRSIIGHLMRQKKADDPITFKVRTVILPVKNQSHVSTEVVKSVTLSPKTRKKSIKTKTGLAEDRKTCYNSQIKSSSAAQCVIGEDSQEFFTKNWGEVSNKSIDEYKRIIEAPSVKKLLDKIESRASEEHFTGLNSDVLLYKSNRESRCRGKLLTNQIRKFSKRSDHIVPESLRNLTYLDKISIKNENQIVLLQNNDQYKWWKLLKRLVKFRNKLPSIPTELKDLSSNSQREKEYAAMNDREQRYPAVCALTQTTNKKFWYGYRADELEILDTVSRPTIEENFMTSKSNGSKPASSLENNCNFVDVFSANFQNHKSILRSSVEGDVSLCCADFEDTQEEKEQGAPKPSEPEDDESLSEAKLRIAAKNEIKFCCIEDRTSSVCTPICDVTSQLRLCAIIKSPNETREANRHGESSNICCCDGLNKLKNAHSKSHDEFNRKNVGIGDADVRSISTSSQTESIKKEPQSHAISQDCGCNSVSRFPLTQDKAYTQNVDIDSKSIAINKDKLPDDVDHLKSGITDGVTVRNNIKNSSSASLDVPDSSEGESLVLEVKMLKPIFSMELKRRQKYQRKAGSVDKRNSCELPKQDERELRKASDATLSCGIQTSQIFDVEDDSKHRIEACSGVSTSSNPVAVRLPEKSESNNMEEKVDNSDCDRYNILRETSGLLKNCQIETDKTDETDINDLNSVACSEKTEPKLEENLTNETEALRIGALIGTVERSLQHITDPIISQKLADMIKYIRDQDQDQSYSSMEVSNERQACETSKTSETLEKNECDDDIGQETVLTITEGMEESQKPCKSLPAPTGTNSSRNFQEVQVEDCKMLHDRNESKHSDGGVRNSEMTEDSYCGVEEVASRLSVASSQLENYEDSESSKYYCCHGELTEVDINAFARTVGSQLRELSIEAALRSQQRIQTLVSNSRLESEIHKKYR